MEDRELVKEMNLLRFPITDDKGEKLFKILGNVEISISVVMYNDFAVVEPADNKTPIKRPIIDYKEMLNSGVLLSQKFESDENGEVVINLTNMLSTKNFLKLINTYQNKYSFVLRVKFSIFKTDKFYPYDEIITGPFEYNTDENGDITFNEILFDSITLESLEVKYKLSELKDELKRVEDLYTITKSNLEQKISLSDKEIEIVTKEYEPTNFNLVVTRLLEFKEGTLNAGLTFCEHFGLDKELQILKTIDRNIIRMSEIYPKVTLEDGEGIPYDRPTRAEF
jgi:hypothetical protein